MTNVYKEQQRRNVQYFPSDAWQILAGSKVIILLTSDNTKKSLPLIESE